MTTARITTIWTAWSCTSTSWRTARARRLKSPDTKGNVVAATFTVTMKDGQAQVETDSTKPYTVVVHQ